MTYQAVGIPRTGGFFYARWAAHRAVSATSCICGLKLHRGENMNLQKHKNIRLKGKALAQLNSVIYERDGGCCIICGAYIQPGTKFHHVWQGADKEDVKEKGVMLCGKCHHEAHFGKLIKWIRQKCKSYLEGLYGYL